VTTHADLASAPGSPLDRAALHEIVAGLNADGGTNFHDGLQAGFELSLSAYDPARQNRVIMLSDGLPTVGILDDQAIITMAEDYIGSGIGLTTVGVGLDFNVELMRGLAERGAGNFYFLEDPSAVQEVFTQELDYAVTPLALGVAIDVEASPNYQLGQVTGTRLWKTTGDTGSMFLPAVFLASRESNDPGGEGRRGGGSALFIDLLPVPGTDGPDVATIHLRFRLPDSDEIIEQTIVVENPAAPGAVGDAPYYSHEAMAKQYAMYNMFLGLREATRSADYSYDCAIAQLTDVTREAELWNRDFADEDITADRALVAQFLANLRNSGGRSEAELGYDPCAGGPYYDDDYYAACQVAPGASGAGGAAMVAMMGLALLWVRRRSRRA
jgi:Ca-activated chloride channel family protein